MSNLTPEMQAAEKQRLEWLELAHRWLATEKMTDLVLSRCIHALNIGSHSGRLGNAR